jgi:rubredoxin
LNTTDCGAENKRGRHIRKSKRRVPRDLKCSVCDGSTSFSWKCRSCGFTFCQNCMNENLWALTCNGITWGCPDCGEKNDLGNQ